MNDLASYSSLGEEGISIDRARDLRTDSFWMRPDSKVASKRTAILSRKSAFLLNAVARSVGNLMPRDRKLTGETTVGAQIGVTQRNVQHALISPPANG